MILITIMMMKMKMKMLWMLMVVMMMIKVYSFWFGREEELVSLHSSEKIDMGGVATEKQCLNDLYILYSIFVVFINIPYELTSWNKSIGCCCWR